MGIVRMTGAQSRAEKQFAVVCVALLKYPGVTHAKSGSRLFGSSTLKVHDKNFAMVASSGEFVVKLPKARVDELVASGAGERFDANHGCPMNEWLDVRSQSLEEWLQLALEALKFVGS